MVNVMLERKRKRNSFKLYQRKLLGAFLLLFFAPTALAASQNLSKPITIVYGSDCVPFHFQNSEKEPDGIIIDKWKLFSKTTVIDITFIPAAWEDTLKMVKNGGADVHAGLFFSKQRDAYLDYGPQLLTSQTHIFWDKRLPAPADLNSFKPFSVGVIKENFAQTWLATHMPGLHLIASNNNDEGKYEIAKSHHCWLKADFPQ